MLRGPMLVAFHPEKYFYYGLNDISPVAFCHVMAYPKSSEMGSLIGANLCFSAPMLWWLKEPGRVVCSLRHSCPHSFCPSPHWLISGKDLLAGCGEMSRRLALFPTNCLHL